MLHQIKAQRVYTRSLVLISPFVKSSISEVETDSIKPSLLFSYKVGSLFLKGPFF